jgi:hypothetical protein
MQNVSCPSCGAPLAFKSHAAVMAVCEFCRATVIKDAESVRDIGKMSAVLEDYSPIQIGTSGVAGTRQFSVIGRIQLRYAQGFWNEWFLLYDDGATGWLGDSSGLYVITTERALAADTPSFPDIEVGKLYTIEGERFTASEKREAQCIGGQGELPFKVGEGWRVRVADMRAAGRFVTLDYSEGERPVLYDGVSVKLEQLKCQLLRDDEQIKASAGRYRGKLDALDCPSCGSAIRYLPGVTSALVCPACAARLDAASSQVQVLQAGEKVERARLSLPLGASANILGSSRTVIGAIRRRDGEGESWTEYLLYSARAGFMWLIESDDGWYRSTVLDTWPSWTWTGADNARLEGVPYTRLYDYPATVTFAAGAFNWRVAVGDQVRVYEFEAGPNTIAAELTAEEMTWSRSILVAHDQIRTWFGTAAPRLAESKAAIKPERNALPVKFMWWIIGLIFIPLMAHFFTTAIIIVIALVALFFPPAVFGNDK